MSVYITDGVSAMSAVVFNKFIVGDTETSGNYMCVSYRINYNGAAWVVDTGYGSKRSASDITAAWNAGDNRLDITFSGLLKNFTDEPSATVAPEAPAAHASDANYDPQVRVTSATAALVRFRDLNVSLTDFVTAENAKMAFYITLFGPID